MKIILSRKGFDSGAGGSPSPILPDGTLLSIPIPDKTGNCSYEDLTFPTEGKTYLDILNALNPGRDYCHCHLDPDIRTYIRKTPPEWVPAFGQIDASQTHLTSKGIKKGDLFLFFGWYKQTEYLNGKLSFVMGAPDLQVIYGYLQIGDIITGKDVKNYPWHPHSDDSHIYDKNGNTTNNTIYLASDYLDFDGIASKLPGSGVLSLAENRVLTEKGKSRTRWKLNDVLLNVNLSYHNKECIKDDYFQSRYRGQEFVFDEDRRATEWAKHIIMGE